MDRQGQAYHLATSFAWPYSPWFFFFSGFIKDAVYESPLATNLPELAGRLRDAVATVILDLLNNVWTEIEYRYDICRATHGTLVEHL
jgi:hypothetical protein